MRLEKAQQAGCRQPVADPLEMAVRGDAARQGQGVEQLLDARDRLQLALQDQGRAGPHGLEELVRQHTPEAALDGRTERQVKQVKSAGQAARSLSAHDTSNNLLHLRRDHLTAAEHRASRTQTCRVWAEISSVITAASSLAHAASRCPSLGPQPVKLTMPPDLHRQRSCKGKSVVGYASSASSSAFAL